MKRTQCILSSFSDRRKGEHCPDLFVLKVDKELSFGERKMLDTARNLLLKELSLATDKEKLFQEEEVKQIFGVS